MLTPFDPPAKLTVPEKFAAAAVVVPVSVGAVRLLFVNVCAPSVVAKTVPTCGKLSVLLADKLCAAACQVCA